MERALRCANRQFSCTAKRPAASRAIVAGLALACCTAAGGALGQTLGRTVFTNTGTVNGNWGVSPNDRLVNYGTITGTVSIAVAPQVIVLESHIDSHLYSLENYGRIGGGGAPGLLNRGSAANNSGGTINGGVSNQGSFTNSGTINGGALNQGSFTNSGTINGLVINVGALFNVLSGIEDLHIPPSFGADGVVYGAQNGGNGGLFFGYGSVQHLANFGTVSPGNSIGTLTVTGNHMNGGTGTYQVEVNGSGQSDLIRVGGTASLQGGTVAVAVLPDAPVAARTTYTILTATGGVTGTYASVVDPYPFLLPSLGYDASNVYLTLQIGGFAAAAQTTTQYAVGIALDAGAGSATGDFATILGTLATLQAGQVLPFMTAISGQNYSAFSSAMVQGAQLFMNNFASQAGGGGSPASNRVALAEACDVACDTTTPALWGAWGGALGGLGTIGANASTGGVTYNAGGFAAGLDRLVAPNTRVGVTAGYTTGSQWVSGFNGKGMTDTFLAGLYGGYNDGKVYADAVGGYAYGANQMWRTIAIPGLQPRTAQGYTGANQWYGQVETGYRFDIGTAADATITPFARLQGYTGTQNAFSETGAQSLDLTVATQTTSSLRSVLGAQLGGAIDLGWREKLALQFRLGWSHEYASTARPVTATLGGAPLSPFTTYGIAPQRDGAVVGFSASSAVAEATSLYVRYEGTLSGQDSAHALTAGVRMSW